MNEKRVAILQSNYIPWKGYFDIINSVDLFIFHDDLQYTVQDWRNRNRIQTPIGPKWITIPCGRNEKRLISEVEISDHTWQLKHWRLLNEYYRKTPFFTQYRDMIEYIYMDMVWKNLSDFNQFFIKFISKEILSINTTFDDSRHYNLQLKKADRVIELLTKCEASHYLSGPSAKDYLNDGHFKNLGIGLEWMDYSNYKEYPQTNSSFTHNVTILDLLFNVGPDFHHYMKSFIK